MAEKRREVKGRGEKERYTHLNAEFQRIARRDKKAFLSDPGKEIEQRQDRGSGVLPDILEHLPPKTRVCLLYCFVLSPLTFLGSSDVKET